MVTNTALLGTSASCAESCSTCGSPGAPGFSLCWCYNGSIQNGQGTIDTWCVQNQKGVKSGNALRVSRSTSKTN